MRRLGVTALFLIAAFFCSWKAGQWARDFTAGRMHEQGSDKLLLVVSQLRKALDEFRYLPFLIAQNEDVAALLEHGSDEQSKVVSRFLEQANLVAGSTSLFVLDRHGRSRAFSHWREENDFNRRSHFDTDYFMQARRGEEGRYISIVEDRSAAFFVSAPIYAQQLFIGAAVVRVDLDLLRDKLPADQELLFVEPGGWVILATRAEWQGKRVDALSRNGQAYQLADGTQVELWPELAKKERLVQSVVLDDLDWQVMVTTPSKPLNQNAQLATVATFILFSLAGLMLLYVRERHLKKRSQQETRDALARSEEQQRTIINKAQVGLLTLDTSGAITFANAMALQQFGLSLPLVLGQPVKRLLANPDQFGPVKRALSRLNHSGFSPLTGYEAVGQRADSTEFPIMLSIKRMREKPEAVYLVTIIDISRRKQLERALQDVNESLEQKVEERTLALREAQEELVQAGKMAALGRMSTAVVHELNQPLTAMRNYVAICKHMLEQPEALEQNLSIVDDLTNRMAVITSQLKTFAYRKPEKLVPVSACTAVDQALVLFRGRLEEQSVELNWAPDQDPDKFRVMADTARLEQVLVNLIKNALDAMQGESRPVLTVSVYSENTDVIIAVADKGPGISEEALGQLFEPFFTTKEIGSGLGLGLAIVRSIVSDLDGSIDASNLDSGGAEFKVRLKACEGNN